MPKTFGDRLVLAMRHRDLTREDLARRTGISVSTIYRYTEDRTTPSAARLGLIARELRVSPNDLLDFDPATLDYLGPQDTPRAA